jgi:YD repeat-containing protein
MNMQYNYSPNQNNGRIISSNDSVTGENVTYTYDALNRLSTATASGLWGQAYTYDGFGNLTGKTVTLGSGETGTDAFYGFAFLYNTVAPAKNASV